MLFVLASLAAAVLLAIPAEAQALTASLNGSNQTASTPTQPSQATVSCKQTFGHARVHVHVNKDGQLSDLKVVKSSGDTCLDKKAITAVSAYDFKSGHGFRPADFEIDVNITSDVAQPAQMNPSTSPPPNDSAVDVAPIPLAPPSDITPPKSLGNPSYTPACKLPGLHSQIVNLSFNVTTEGQATDIQIKDKISDELAQCAIQTVQATHFTPAMQNGKPVVVRIELALNLEIK